MPVGSGDKCPLLMLNRHLNRICLNQRHSIKMIYRPNGLFCYEYSFAIYCRPMDIYQWKYVIVCDPVLPRSIYKLKSRHNGWHFPDDISKRICLDENVWISIEISLKFVPRGPIDNISSLVPIRIYASLGPNELKWSFRSDLNVTFVTVLLYASLCYIIPYCNRM